MSKNILVIDDDAFSRAAVQVLLEDEGYQVSCAVNGRDGLAIFRRLRPDLVVTDLIMPEMEGIETIRTLRSEWPGGSIIAMSGGARVGNADYLRMAKELGANAVLAKPFEPDDLIAMVESCWAQGAG
jgi:CheY-like chemotaxis protein